jgi:hypothetical protein
MLIYFFFNKTIELIMVKGSFYYQVFFIHPSPCHAIPCHAMILFTGMACGKP